MFDRITSDPTILGGKPCVRGTRISVEFILELIASRGTDEQIIKKYPQLKAEDIEQAIRFAAQTLKNDVVITARLAG
ncbi:MAG: DUF433 domain-containing protein [Pyrinomonadaceae bacterium]|nr:DUF433 domain-containing protein [Phycisphaerales bacterium]